LAEVRLTPEQTDHARKLINKKLIDKRRARQYVANLLSVGRSTLYGALNLCWRYYSGGVKARPLVFPLRLILLISTSILLYFGLGMLLLPGPPGEPYWEKARVYYGALPFLSGVILATACGRVALRIPQADELRRSVKRHWIYALRGVPVVFAFLCANDLVPYSSAAHSGDPVIYMACFSPYQGKLIAHRSVWR
jgi:hypothetical protein